MRRQLPVRVISLLLLAAGLPACGGGDDYGGSAPPPPPVVLQPGMLGDGNMRMLVEGVRARHGAPALGAVVVDEGQVADLAASGRRSVDAGSNVTDDDLWHLGSISKAMTATLAGVLVEQAVIDWDTTPNDVWPGLSATIHAQYQQATMVQLLAHQAGMPVDVTAIPSINDVVDTAPGTFMQKRQIWAEELLQMPPSNGIGGYRYTNAGYIVVGAMLETATGADWETMMRQFVFQPLGMHGCGFGAPGTPGQTDQPLGHRVENGVLVAVPPGPGSDNPRSIGPAGTIHCPLADYAKYMIAHIDGERGVPGLLSVATFRFLHTPVAAHSYALGWETSNSQAWAQGPVMSHDGSNLLWYANAGLAPGIDAGVLIVTNAANAAATDAIDELGQLMIDRILASP